MVPQQTSYIRECKSLFLSGQHWPLIRMPSPELSIKFVEEPRISETITHRLIKTFLYTPLAWKAKNIVPYAHFPAPNSDKRQITKTYHWKAMPFKRSDLKYLQDNKKNKASLFFNIFIRPGFLSDATKHLNLIP